MTTLHTPRLTLRPIVEADGPALIEMFSNPRVMRYWSSPPWRGDEELQRFMAYGRQMDDKRNGLRLAITRRDDLSMGDGGGRLIGQCTLFGVVMPSRRAELGYSLAESAWGNGYAAEACAELVRHGFEDLDLNRIEADIDPRNEPSAAVLRRLGFVQEGLLRQRWIVEGEVSDTAYFGLLRGDWQARSRLSSTAARP